MNDRANVCQAGHERHERLRFSVPLRGRCVVHEWPAIPERLSLDLRVEAYDRDAYAGFRGYCTGQDELSHALRLNGRWEGFETLVVLDILDRGDREGVVLDFGAHVGWYSLIAGKLGYRVAAYEADAENVDVLRGNARDNGCDHLVDVVHAWVDAATAVPRQRVRLLKSDVEGAEDAVVEACAGLFAAGLVDYALLEVSPVLAGHYARTCGRIVEWGYDAFEVPDKACVDVAAFEADPLGALTALCRIPPEDVARRAESCRQANWLFARRP